MRGVVVGTGKRLTEVVHRIATLLTSGSRKSRELQESKARLEEAQRVAHVGYWVWDLDSDRVTWSDETYRIYGLMPQEGPIVLATVREMVHPEDRETVFRIAEEAILGRVRPDAEHRIVGRSTILTLTGDRATGEAYTLAHHLTIDGGKRQLMIAALRYYDTFAKIGGAWLFAERPLYVDWLEERPLS